MTTLLGSSPFDADVARRAPDVLRVFNLAGVLQASDVHVALRLGELSGSDDRDVMLGTALAVRAPRLGHVCVDLASVRSTVSAEDGERQDLALLPWPETGEWIGRLEASPLVGTDRPLRLEGTLLYLDRYWAAERQVASDVLGRAEHRADGVDLELLRRGLDAWFEEQEGPNLQRLAAASAVLRGLSVIAGGPGTGKTTTVARVLALLGAQAAEAGRRPPLVALAAPTGKAAARLEEAVKEEGARLELSPDARAWLVGLQGQTLHRLLGWVPNRTRFAHHRLNRLPHDVVIVDETSMVDLPLMGRLVEAVRPDSRLVLVGDPEQLASVEAGAVLGDLVGPAGDGLRMRKAARDDLAAATGGTVPATAPRPSTPVGDGVVVLRQVHRFGGAIAELAEAVRVGEADGALEILARGGDSGDSSVRWIVTEPGVASDAGALIRSTVVAAARSVTEAAMAGRGAEALAALGRFRLLCAHRRGPDGAASWTERIEGWLRSELGPSALEGPWYAGRPLLVTANDYSLQLFNGDTGVVVARADGGTVAVFERGGGLLEVSPSRLAAVDTVYAMTVHKAQGSQFETVAVVLPPPDSPILTRELLYTAVTRGRNQVVVAGSEESIRTAVLRPISRSSGLRKRLWQPAGSPTT